MVKNAHSCSVDIPHTSLTANERHTVKNQLRARLATIKRNAEEGLATAEYAIAMIAAAGFAGLLIVILKSEPVRAALTSIIETALGTR
jgi:hypothetical protein